MGTNYYAVRTRPTVSEPIHIGKSSSGWRFLFQRQISPPAVWDSYEQVKTWLKENTVDKHDYVIIDEYDEIIPYDDFIELVESKQSDTDCKYNPENFRYGVRNVDGYRFADYFFS